MKAKQYKVIAVLDTIEDKTVQQSLELLTFAEIFLSGDLSGMLLAVPGRNVFSLCASISEKYGVDTAALEHEEMYYPNPVLLNEILAGVIEEHRPDLIIFAHTIRNCQIAAGLSVSLGASSITAVESFMKDHMGHVFQRSVFNGKIKASVRPLTDLKILTVLQGSYSIPEKKNSYKHHASAEVKKINIDNKKIKLSGISSEKDSGVKLEEADVIVSIGRGIGKEVNLELIRQTAALFKNSAIGASRPVCDQKWLPFSHQVGITGKTVSPKLYLACGISGSQQHIAGMKNSQLIIAINKDPNASIFSIADYSIVADILSFLPALAKKFHERFGA